MLVCVCWFVRFDIVWCSCFEVATEAKVVFFVFCFFAAVTVLILSLGEHRYKLLFAIFHTCQPRLFTGIKYIFFFHYFGGIWHYWKMDTGKHNFHKILLLF